MLQPRPTTILADDHPMMLEGLGKLLDPILDIVATATAGPALLEAAARLHPDLVLTDISMPGVDGINATRQLASTCPRTRVVILSFHDEPSWVRAAFEAGAWGYLNKTAAPEEIEGAVREVLSDRFYVSPSVARGLFMPTPSPQPPPALEMPLGTEELTPRELEVIGLVGRGLPNKEIANSLGISVTTVRTHLNSVYGKLGSGNRVELALYAVGAAAAPS